MCVCVLSVLYFVKLSRQRVSLVCVTEAAHWLRLVWSEEPYPDITTPNICIHISMCLSAFDEEVKTKKLHKWDFSSPNDNITFAFWSCCDSRLWLLVVLHSFPTLHILEGISTAHCNKSVYNHTVVC